MAPQRLSGRNRALGEGLGLYHAQAGAPLENDKLKALLHRHIPVILTLSRGGHTMLGHFGRIGPAISALLQQHKTSRACSTGSARSGVSTA